MLFAVLTGTNLFLLWLVFTVPPVGVHSIVISMSVYLYVYLFVCPRAYLKNYMSIFHQIFCTCYLRIPLMAVQYIMYFPFLWMISCSHIIEQMGETRHMLRPVCHVVAPVGRQTTLFGQVCQVAALGAKSVAFDCILFMFYVFFVLFLIHCKFICQY